MKALLDYPVARRRRRRGARAASRRDVSARHRRQDPPLVPQGARAERARADHARAPRPRARGAARACATGSTLLGHHRAGAHVSRRRRSRHSSLTHSHMTVLVVGSVALDSVETPFGKADNVLGGSGTFFSASASHLAPVQLVGVVGSDYPLDKLKRAFATRPVDLAGLERAEGASFRWRGRYRHDLNSAETLETHLGVFSNFRAEDSRAVPQRAVRLPRQHRSAAAARRARRRSSKPKLVACDTMNFWIESRRPDLLELLEHVDLITLNDAEARQLTEEFNLVKAARWIMARGPKLVVIKKGEHGAFMFTRIDASSSRRRIRSKSVFDPTGAGDSFAGGFMGYLARSGRPVARRTCGAPWCTARRWARSPSRNSRSSVCSRSRRRTSRARVGEFHRLVSFEQELPRERRRSTTAPPASTSTRRTTRSTASRRTSLSTLTAGTRGEFGGFGGMFRVPTDVPKPVLVVERRRRRHEAQGRDRRRPPRHGRPRSREPLRERHPRAGRDAALLPRLRRVRHARAGGRRGGRRGRRGRLPRERLRAARRRDGRDAGRLHAAGLRSGRVHRRLRGRGRDPRPAARARRRRARSGSRAAGSTPTAIRSRVGSSATA